MELRWVDREPPLSICGALAREDVAVALLSRLCALEDDALTNLRGVMSHEPLACVLLGSAEHLPWVDGIVYLGRPPHTHLYIPTTMCAEGLTDALLERVLGGALTESGPLAALPSPQETLLFPMSGARPLTRAVLERQLRIAS